MEWAGAPSIDKRGHIKRSVNMPEEAYKKIETAIAQGHVEGDIYTGDQSRFHWFLDR
jgi:hypothetical protein